LVEGEGGATGTNLTKGDGMSDEKRKQVEQEKQPELRRPDEAIEDLEPERKRAMPSMAAT
jgi:hypothetical protein